MDDEDNDLEGLNAALGRFGLPARAVDRPAIIEALEGQIRLEADEEGDHFLMRLLCAQLFSIGIVEDSLLIWRAKGCNFDTHCGIDVQFLCGAGLDRTKGFLADAGAGEARDYVARCEASGDFEGFDPGRVLGQARAYYGVA